MMMPMPGKEHDMMNNCCMLDDENDERLRHADVMMSCNGMPMMCCTC